MRTAILFKTHRWNVVQCLRYLSLCDDLRDTGYTVTALYDGAPADIPQQIRQHGDVLCLDRTRLLSLCKDGRYHPRSHRFPNDAATSAVQGLLPLLWYSQQHAADRYWQVEPDVVFTGNWHDFFEVFASSSSHLIATHVKYGEDYWKPWMDNNLTYEGVFDSHTVPFTSLNAVCGISSALAQALLAGYATGMIGHFEAVVATRCAQVFGIDALEDISDGRFCHKENRHRFYRAWAKDMNIGTFGWQQIPPQEMWRLRERHLYHSCKCLTQYEVDHRFALFMEVAQPYVDAFEQHSP